jgi:hypothetical protein
MSTVSSTKPNTVGTRRSRLERLSHRTQDDGPSSRESAAVFGVSVGGYGPRRSAVLFSGGPSWLCCLLRVSLVLWLAAWLLRR